MCGNGVGIHTTQAALIHVAVAGTTRRLSVLCLTVSSTTHIIAASPTVSVWCGRRNSRERSIPVPFVLFGLFNYGGAESFSLLFLWFYSFSISSGDKPVPVATCSTESPMARNFFAVSTAFLCSP